MLIFLLFILFPICEIYLLYKFTIFFNLWLTIAYLGLGMWVGTLLLKFTGRSAMGRLQNEIVLNRTPQKNLVKKLFYGVAGILFFLPGILSDIVAFLLIFPPTQWIVVRFFQNWMLSLLKNGQFKIFTQFSTPFSQPTHENHFEDTFNQHPPLEEAVSPRLDVQSLKDVTPKK